MPRIIYKKCVVVYGHMAQEIEAKVLNIDIAALEQKLINIGATKTADYFFKSVSFDLPEGAFLRLRSDGKKTTIAYKKRIGASAVKGGNDAGMEEIETEVGDFDDTKQILLRAGLPEKFSQEKKRTTWTKDDVTFDIDVWPRISPYLEVEAATWEEVDAAILALGFTLEQKRICSASEVFTEAGIIDTEFKTMTFSEWIKKDGTVIKL